MILLTIKHGIYFCNMPICKIIYIYIFCEKMREKQVRTERATYSLTGDRKCLRHRQNNVHKLEWFRYQGRSNAIISCQHFADDGPTSGRQLTDCRILNKTIVETNSVLWHFWHYYNIIMYIMYLYYIVNNDTTVYSCMAGKYLLNTQ